jgi:hypothetical protein
MYKTILLPVIMYGCGAWSLTLREEHRLSMFENRVLKRIFGTKKEEVLGGGGGRRMHIEELLNLYTSPNIIQVIKLRRVGWTRNAACIGKMRNAYKILVGKHEGKKSLRSQGNRWGDNIRMDHREIGWEVVDWIKLAQERNQC